MGVAQTARENGDTAQRVAGEKELREPSIRSLRRYMGVMSGIDKRVWRILAHSIALIIGPNESEAVSALGRVRDLAKRDGITSGALKEAAESASALAGVVNPLSADMIAAARASQTLVTSLQRKIATLEGDQLRMLHDLELLEEECRGLRSELVETHKECSSAYQQSADLHAKVIELLDQIEILERRVAQLGGSEKKAGLSQRVRDLETALGFAKGDTDELRAALAQAISHLEQTICEEQT